MTAGHDGTREGHNVTDLRREFEIASAELEAALPGPAPGELAPEPGVRTHPFRALRHREFNVLFAASSIGDVGYWISFVALQAYMADLTDESALWLGFLFFANLVPMLIFSPFAGVVADRMERTRLLVIARSAVSAIAGILALLVFADLATPWVLAVAAFALGTAFGFLGPTQSAVVANTVPDGDLLSAVSMAAAGNNLCRIAGPALAAPILAVWGPGWAFTVYAATNLTVAALLLLVHVHSELDVHSERGPWARMADGFRHARDRPPAFAALVTMSVISLFGGAQIALYPLFANDVHDRPTRDFTVIVVASGVGAVLGAVGTALRRRVPRLRSTSRWCLAYGVASIGFAVAPTWNGALACAVLVGFCYYSTTTALNTLLQHLADDDKRARMMSLFIVAWGGLIPIGALWMGALADVTSAPFVVALGAVVCVVFAVGQLSAIRLRHGDPADVPLR